MRKSPQGWKVIEPRASGIVKVPPLIFVPAGAVDLLEKSATLLRDGATLRIGRRCLGSANESGKVVDIGEAVRARSIVGLGDGIADIGDFVRLEAVGNAHFVEISIAGEREQAGVLILPAETAYAHLSGRFHDGHEENLAADFPMRGFALLLREIGEGLVGDGLHKAVSQ
jgi:hypothetical protein